MARYKWLGGIVRLFLSALFLLLVLFMLVQSVERSYAATSARRLLVTSKSETMELHAKRLNGTAKFDESMHEVPSGANPDSNR
jgi:hypothetical protein